MWHMLPALWRPKGSNNNNNCTVILATHIKSDTYTHTQRTHIQIALSRIISFLYLPHSLSLSLTQLNRDTLGKINLQFICFNGKNGLVRRDGERDRTVRAEKWELGQLRKAASNTFHVQRSGFGDQIVGSSGRLIRQVGNLPKIYIFHSQLQSIYTLQCVQW